MRLKYLAILALLSVWLAMPAVSRAADGAICNNASTPACQEVPGFRYQFLCGSQAESVNDTDCQATVTIAKDADWCTVDLVEQQALCTLPTMTIEETDKLTSTDRGWTTLGTLTGIVSPLISQVDPKRAIGPLVRATFADITDTDCTRVTVVIKCHY